MSIFYWPHKHFHTCLQFQFKYRSVICEINVWNMSQLVGTDIATYRHYNVAKYYLNYFFYVKIIRKYIEICNTSGETLIPEHHCWYFLHENKKWTGWHSSNFLGLYSGAAGFKPHQRHYLSWDFFCGSQSFHRWCWDVTTVGHGHFLPNPLQFVTHWSPCHSVPCSF
jgi:hypothetical protein